MKLTAYLKVIVFLFFHTIFSWVILYYSSRIPNPVISFSIPVAVGALTGIILLYFFLHDKSFKTARELENAEAKMERKWLRRFSHSGKIFTVVAIGTISGPIFGALTIRLLMPKYRFKYLLVSLVNIPSAFFYTSVVKVLISAYLKL